MSKPISDWLMGGDCNTLSNRRPEDGPERCPECDHIEAEFIRNTMTKIAEKGIEITVTFKPELQVRFNGKTLTLLIYTTLQKYKLDVVLIGEYSKVGIYHMHGVIYASPKTINILRRRLPREIGRTELKPLKYVETWIDYCLKDDYTGGVKRINQDETIMLHQTDHKKA